MFTSLNTKAKFQQSIYSSKCPLALVAQVNPTCSKTLAKPAALRIPFFEIVHARAAQQTHKWRRLDLFVYAIPGTLIYRGFVKPVKIGSIGMVRDACRLCWLWREFSRGIMR
jgi:hypothetical protein